MPEIKLKPCPFCGWHNIYILTVYTSFRDEPERKRYEAVCDSCGACISTYDEFETPEEAAEAWNHRADTRNESQPVLDDGAFGACPNCEYEFNSELRNEYEIRYCPNCGQKLDWRTDNGNGMDQR